MVRIACTLALTSYIPMQPARNLVYLGGASCRLLRRAAHCRPLTRAQNVLSMPRSHCANEAQQSARRIIRDAGSNRRQVKQVCTHAGHLVPGKRPKQRREPGTPTASPPYRRASQLSTSEGVCFLNVTHTCCGAQLAGFAQIASHKLGS